MNTEKFLTAYNESRNGADHFVRHSLVRSFIMSDGVQECAEAGCYWLTDIAATELPAVLKKRGELLGCLNVEVRQGKAKLELTGSSDSLLWSRAIDWTDLPDGDWMFYVADDRDGTIKMILPTEY